MFENICRFREKMSNRHVCVGSCITFHDPMISEALAPSVDFLWLDTEHTSIDLESLMGHLLAARAAGVAALVRVPGSEVSVLKRVLDMGAEGIIVPQVRSADEVRRIVAACRYQPNGDRGWGPRRANNYGRQPQDEYVAESNKNLFVSVQIENVDALASLHEIVAVKGLDSVVIGPYDLSASMGLMGQVLHPDVTSAVQAIIAAAHGAGRLVGFGTGSDVAYAAYAISMGADWIQVGCDFTYLIDSADRAFKEVRRLAFN